MLEAKSDQPLRRSPSLSLVVSSFLMRWADVDLESLIFLAQGLVFPALQHAAALRHQVLELRHCFLFGGQVSLRG